MSNIQQISEGLRKELLQAGSGAKPSPGDTITVHCTGSLANPPKKFWSTKDSGQSPFTFQVGIGQVIKGWDEGCMTMCLNEKAKLYVAGFKGYGQNGFAAWGIPPNAELIFEIEILSITKK